MRTRNWSIRSKIIALVAVPLTALLALWVFATALTVGPAVNLLSAQTLLDTVGNPGKALVAELQRERRLSVEYIASGRANASALTAQRAATDRVVTDFRRTAGSDDANGAASAALRGQIKQIFGDLDALAANRVHIDRSEIDAVGVQNLYNGILDTCFHMFEAAAVFGEERIDEQIRALVTIGRSQEFLSRIDSLLGGALAAGRFSEDARAELLQAIGTGRFLVNQAIADLPERDRIAYQRLSTGAAFNRLRELQDDLVRDSRPNVASPVSAADWQPAFDTSTKQWREFESNAIDSIGEETTPVAAEVLIRLGLAGLLGLVALVLSILVSVRVGRSIVGRLIRLRGEAREMAGERLPAVVRRLQRGETVDVDVETPPLEYGRDEIGQLGHAFNEVQRTAVQSAVEEASVRRGINEVFLNIARRSQTLLHRQLALLDKMERRETEPQELEDLYRVDHLATRMRRHAEDLVILAGAAPGRGWRNPVPVIDVVRGAISEVEDYKRIDIQSVESSAVLGRAVGDVIHLIAELLENAASFSPPHTRVQVVGQILPNGYALEIEDRGLGMSAEAIAEANRRLLQPPDFDPADSARLGLFVVAQLAHRHGIRVSLRPSAYGGVTAIVLVPGELVAPGEGRAALPAGPSASDKAWDRPLVGSGTDDPARSSLAALQWQGAEELRSISTPGRPVTIDGLAGGEQGLAEPVEARLAGADRAGELPAGQGGPMPSAVADGLSEEGLVQRRRTRPRRAPEQPSAPPALLPPNMTSPAGVNGLELPSAGNGLTSNGIGPSATGRTSPELNRPGLTSGGAGAEPSTYDPAGLGLSGPTRNGTGPGPNGSGPNANGTGLGASGTGLGASGTGLGAGSNGMGTGSNGPDPSGAGPSRNGTGPGRKGAGPGRGGRSARRDGGLRHGDEPAALPAVDGVPAPARPVRPPRIPSPRPAPEQLPPEQLPPEQLLPEQLSPEQFGAPAPGPETTVEVAPTGLPLAEPSAAEEPLLPRRVRQASLAPQLREPMVERADAAPSRSPEQVRSLMSALQQGTNRGRRAAAAKAAADSAEILSADMKETVGKATWSEAATVIFPAVQDPPLPGEDRSTDKAPGAHHQNRPEKDA